MKKILTIEDFEILKDIGEGQYAKVIKAREKSINKVIALKIFSNKKLDRQVSSEIIKREVKIHNCLKHENILKFLGYVENSEEVFMILEYCQMGEMGKDIYNCNGYPNERAATYMYQLCHALQFCHKNAIIHRDIKSENILLTETGSIKLADFGCSKRIKCDKRATMCGTPNHLAPEVLSGEAQNVSIDIWCSGVLLYEMLTTKNPFQQDDPAATRQRIMNATFEIDDSIHSLASYLLFAILRRNPNERLSASCILSHPYLLRFAEQSLTQCRAALDQWQQIKDDSVKNIQFLSFNVQCPALDFGMGSPMPMSDAFQAIENSFLV